MALPKARPPGGVLTASAARLDLPNSEYEKRKSLTWQNRALAYSKSVTELNFASRFYARMLKQARYYPAKITSDGTLEEIKTGPPAERMRQLRDRGGGTTMLNSAYGRLRFITGEGILLGRALGRPSENWNFFWIDEVEIETGRNDRVTKIIHMPNGVGGKKIEYSPSEARAYPMWAPSPGLSGEAESPMESVLDIAEELIILTAAIHSTAVTRLTNGILVMPIEASPGGVGDDASEDPEEDPFAADLGEHMAAQSENPWSAEHRMPLITWISADLIEKIKHIKLHDPANDYLERELRKEARETLGYGLDMPPEALTGLGQSNHWSAIQILGDMWKSHGLQIALEFAADLADVYLRPGLEQDKYPDWEDVVVGVDGSAITQKTDRSEDAKTALQEGAIGPRGFRKLTNIPDDLAPTPEEFAQMLEWKKGTPPADERTDREDPRRNGDAPGEPAAPGAEGDSGRRSRVVAAAFREMGAAEVALMRCRELAGMRLRNQKVWKALEAICVDCASEAGGSPHSLVAHILGPERLQQLRLDPATLVKGGADSLRDVLIGWGYPETQANALAEMVELFAARSLFEQKTALPAGFEAQVVRTKELVGAQAA